jgi:hypothetical protein
MLATRECQPSERQPRYVKSAGSEHAQRLSCVSMPGCHGWPQPGSTSGLTSGGFDWWSNLAAETPRRPAAWGPSRLLDVFKPADGSLHRLPLTSDGVTAGQTRPACGLGGSGWPILARAQFAGSLAGPGGAEAAEPRPAQLVKPGAGASKALRSTRLTRSA